MSMKRSMKSKMVWLSRNKSIYLPLLLPNKMKFKSQPRLKSKLRLRPKPRL